MTKNRIGGVYALDANSGDVMWHNKGFGIHSAPEGSITEVGGSLILVNSPEDHPAQLIALVQKMDQSNGR